MSKDEIIRVGYHEEDITDRTARWIGRDNLKALQNAKVLLVGAGAVGNEVSKNLGLLGVGTIHLVDFDKVTKSNLNRCVFFRSIDHKRKYKVHAVKERLAEISSTEIIPHACKIEDAPPEVWDVDLVIVGVDNDYARYQINMKVFSLPSFMPVINGAMGKTFVEASFLLPGKTACLLCLWRKEYYTAILHQQVQKECFEFFHEILPLFPTISTLTSLVGSIMSTEAIKILAGLKTWQKEGKWLPKLEPNLGMIVRYDTRKHDVFTGKILRNPKCVELMCRTHINEF
ncbi:MAG: ThiF family adenylyltransferase [Candidatus Hodarchaeota archaeon]